MNICIAPIDISSEIWGPIKSEGAIVGPEEGIGAVLGLPGHPQLGRARREEVDCRGVREEFSPVGERGGGGWPVLLQHAVPVNRDQSGSRDHLQAIALIDMVLDSLWRLHNNMGIALTYLCQAKCFSISFCAVVWNAHGRQMIFAGDNLQTMGEPRGWLGGGWGARGDQSF